MKQIIRIGDSNSHHLFNKAVYLGTNNKLFKQQIEQMKKTATHNAQQSLAANQIGFDLSTFIIKIDEQWESFTNPRILLVSESFKENLEHCPSLPFLQFKVKRYDTIQIQYEDQNLKEHSKELNDNLSFTFQHEMDHLLGYTLLDWNVSNLNIEYASSYSKDKRSQHFEIAMKNYISQGKTHYDSNPSIFQRSLKQLNFDQRNPNEGISGPAYLMFQDEEEQQEYERLKKKIELEMFYLL